MAAKCIGFFTHYYFRSAALLSGFAVLAILSFITFIFYCSGSTNIVLALLRSPAFLSLIALVAVLYGIVGYGLARERAPKALFDQLFNGHLSKLLAAKSRMSDAFDEGNQTKENKHVLDKLKSRADAPYTTPWGDNCADASPWQNVRPDSSVSHIRNVINDLDSSKTVYEAIKRNDLRQLQRAMLESHVDAGEVLNSRNKWTALHYAAYYANIEIIDFLLEKAAPTALDSNGHSPCDTAELGFRDYTICKRLTDAYVKAKQEELARLQPAVRRRA